MMVKRRWFGLAIAGGLSALVLCLPLGASAAEVLSPACEVAPDSPACLSSKDTSSGNALYGPEGLLTRAARLLAVVAGIIGVFMVVIAGFKYMVSSGDSSNISSAKNTLLYAMIGMVVAASAQALVFFVLNRI